MGFDLWDLPSGKRLQNYLGKFHNDLTATEPWESLVDKENHSQMALIQVRELFQFTQTWLVVTGTGIDDFSIGWE